MQVDSATEPLPLLHCATKVFQYGERERTVLQGLSIQADKGGCLVLLGPNAAGKSTLLHLLLGIELPSSGEVLLRLEQEDLLSAVLQNYRNQLLPWATVEDNLLLPLGGARASAEWSPRGFLEQAAAIFEEVGYDIPLRAKVGLLSGGQQQLIVLTRASLFRPRVWILDEPASAIDLRRRERAYEMLDNAKSGGTTLIVVTHSIDEVLRLADRVLIFDGGMSILEDIRLPTCLPRDKIDFARSAEGNASRERILDVFWSGKQGA